MSDSIRRITADEYEFALSIFQREFPAKDQIFISNQTGLNDRQFVRPTINGNIRMHMGPLFDKLLATKKNKSLFAHELTHAWQIEHYGLVWYGKQAFNNQVVEPATGDDAYAYTCDENKTLGDYGAEQQGAIVQNYVSGGTCEQKLVERALFSKTWKLLAGSDALDVAVNTDGTCYMINRTGLIYRYVGNDWEQLNGSDGLAIAANGDNVFLVNTSGLIYQRVNERWKKLPGSDAVDIAVAADGNVFMVNSAGKIFNYHISNRWVAMPGSDAARIATGGGQVWMVNRAGKIYRFEPGAGWTQTNGSSGRDIAVTGDGKVFLTNSKGAIYERKANAWTQLDGSSAVAVSANRQRLVMVNTNGRLYYRNY